MSIVKTAALTAFCVLALRLGISPAIADDWDNTPSIGRFLVPYELKWTNPRPNGASINIEVPAGTYINISNDDGASWNVLPNLDMAPTPPILDVPKSVLALVPTIVYNPPLTGIVGSNVQSADAQPDNLSPFGWNYSGAPPKNSLYQMLDVLPRDYSNQQVKVCAKQGEDYLVGRPSDVGCPNRVPAFDVQVAAPLPGMPTATGTSFMPPALPQNAENQSPAASSGSGSAYVIVALIGVLALVAFGVFKFLKKPAKVAAPTPINNELKNRDPDAGKAEWLAGGELLNENKYEEAFRLFQKSAAAGWPLGLYMYGYCLLTGEGTPRNPTLALSNLKAALAEGVDQAALSLAYMYFAGEGVPRNEQAAFALLEEAVAKGVKDAEEALKDARRNGGKLSVPLEKLPKEYSGFIVRLGDIITDGTMLYRRNSDGMIVPLKKWFFSKKSGEFYRVVTQDTEVVSHEGKTYVERRSEWINGGKFMGPAGATFMGLFALAFLGMSSWPGCTVIGPILFVISLAGAVGILMQRTKERMIGPQPFERKTEDFGPGSVTTTVQHPAAGDLEYKPTA